MKYIMLIIATCTLIEASSFSKQTLAGKWEISSAKPNNTVAFGNYIGKERNEVLELVFNHRGKMKVVKTEEVYNYEIIQGKLKIYDTKLYGGNYVVKRKSRYDLFKIAGSYEGCMLVKLVDKKIPGYNPKRDLKMCKISNYPQSTYNDEFSKYDY